MSLAPNGWTVVFLVVLSFAVGAPLTHAADPSEVEALIRKGVELRRAGNDTQALPYFKKAHDLASTPRTAAQLGLVEMALGYQLDAERHLNEGLASPSDQWIRKHREALEKSLVTVRAAIGEITIQGTPAGATVTMNGASVGNLPLTSPVRVGRGPATVNVQAAGFTPETITVNVSGGKREELVVRLRPVEVAAPPMPEAAARLAPTDSSLAKVRTGEDDEERSTPSRQNAPSPPEGQVPQQDGNVLRNVAWVTAAVALTGIGFAAYETVRWNDKLKEFDAVTRPSPTDPMKTVLACGTDEPNRGSLPQCQTLYDDLTRAKTFATIGYAVGGAAAVGAVVLFVISGKEEPAARSAIACAPSGRLTGLSCVLAF